MNLWWASWIGLALPLAFLQGIVRDPLVALYHDALANAPAEEIPALVQKLEGMAGAAPSSPFAPYVHETIQLIGLMYPGSVANRDAQLQTLRSQAAANPAVSEIARRTETLDQYYKAAFAGSFEAAAGLLEDRMFDGSLAGATARADAALRAHDYEKAEALAQEAIEFDPYSPLLAPSYVILGFCRAYRGDASAAAHAFQHALKISIHPTLYGSTRELLLTAYRFARPSPGAVGEIFDELLSTRIGGVEDIKDPRSMIFSEGKLILVDREQVLTLSTEGKAIETKAGRRGVDVAVDGKGRVIHLGSDFIDMGTSGAQTLSAAIGGRSRELKKLRSLAVDSGGNIYLLDQDRGLLRAAPSASGSLAVDLISPARGRLVRIDRRDNLYILGDDQRSVLILSKEGKPLTSITPSPTSGKTSSIEYFALDKLNQIYLLDSNSIQVFSIIEDGSGLRGVPRGAVVFDQRPQLKDLKVIAVTGTGEAALAGKNEGNWVIYR